MSIDIKLIFGIISALLALISFIPYVKAIFNKKTKPHIYSWLVWSILQLIGVIALISGGAKWGTIGLVGGCLISIFVFILAFKYGTKNRTTFDLFCLVGALITTIFFIFTKNVLVSVILITIIDLAGFLPTLRKSYVDPHSEEPYLYLLSGFSNIFAIFAISHYSVATLLYIISLVITNFVCVAIIFLRRK